MPNNYRTWIEKRGYFVFDLMVLYFSLSVYLDGFNSALASIWLYFMLPVRLAVQISAGLSITRAINHQTIRRGGFEHKIWQMYRYPYPMSIKFISAILWVIRWSAYLYVAHHLGNFSFNLTILCAIVYLPFWIHFNIKLPVFLNEFRDYQD